MAEDKSYVLQTAGFDARFPNQNQTKHCWVSLDLCLPSHPSVTGDMFILNGSGVDQNFVDYHKCVNAKGEEFAPCQQFKKAYRALCPNEWVGKWDEQVEAGTFPASLKP
ncbi:cytochrome c oxidase subunit 6b [Kwoniella mangroviensis CBS 10435]|uniref:Cytochrome c oxidase subunit 6b n=1 Tax=Kwoniella mangroviensis CBS 10435 TaxID=1331196 RepID=A0A1B9IKR0_9TREE|nr:cytochrome c oxidase subunit 6b [Kwoniella mangroviensis CBS 8507]OCF56087.1 cytochrome c oxidase subunit 6b [Kwoniella mangroviensis CBS 10435]OCF64994.1 cytochrome c oxidase subunit 6b [Kwoniella mangroviensis CBS 8507]